MLIALANLPFSPLSLPLETQRTIQSFFPQGWAFFTKVPTSENYFVWNANEHSEFVPLDFRTFQAKYLFGLNRKPRVDAQIFMEFSKTIDDKFWFKRFSQFGFIENPPESEKIQVIKVQPRSSSPLCGRHLIMKQQSISWAWRNLDSEATSETGYVIVDGQC